MKPSFAGIGIWIWYLNQAEGGDLDKIAEKALAHNIDWVAVKASDGPNIWTQISKAIELQKRGLKVYSWGYNYGEDFEEGPVVSALNQGVDGHIFDVEAEFAHLPGLLPKQKAEELLDKVLAVYPQAKLAYAPLPVIDYFPGLPYEVLNKECVAMPQFYTKELGTGEDYSIERLVFIWQKWLEKWSEKPLAIYPILQGYGAQTPENLQHEVEVCKQQYGGFSIWRWDTLTPEMWEVLKWT